MTWAKTDSLERIQDTQNARLYAIEHVMSVEVAGSSPLLAFSYEMPRAATVRPELGCVAHGTPSRRDDQQADSEVPHVVLFNRLDLPSCHCPELH